MRHPVRQVISLVLAATLLGVPAPSLACCDGFWSCAAAVASLGLTCAVEALLNSVKQMKQDVDNLRKKTEGDVKQIADATNAAVGDTRKVLDQAVTDARNSYDQALAEAQKIQKDAESRHATAHLVNVPAGALGNAGGTTTGTIARAPTPKSGSQTIAGGPALPAAGGGVGSSGGVARFDQPCDDATVLAGLRRASEQLQKEQKVAMAEAQKAHQNAALAAEQADAAAEGAEMIAATALVVPLLDLADVLDDLIHHPDHLINPVAIVEVSVKRVTDATGTEFDRMTAAIVVDANKSLEESRLRAQEVEKLAAAAAKVASVMGELQKSRTKANCDKLASLVPPTGTPITVHFASVQPGFLQTTSHTSASVLSRAGAGKVKATSLATGVSSVLSTRLRDVVNKQQVAFRPTPVPGAEASFKSYTDAMFRGLSKSQASAKKNELLAEARQRYANDPAMLQKMIALIGGESDVRIRALSAPAPVLR